MRIEKGCPPSSPPSRSPPSFTPLTPFSPPSKLPSSPYRFPAQLEGMSMKDVQRHSACTLLAGSRESGILQPSLFPK
eukprot:355016-Chlamydomonas_euryale.AAC.1